MWLHICCESQYLYWVTVSMSNCTITVVWVLVILESQSCASLSFYITVNDILWTSTTEVPDSQAAYMCMRLQRCFRVQPSIIHHASGLGFICSVAPSCVWPLSPSKEPRTLNGFHDGNFFNFFWILIPKSVFFAQIPNDFVVLILVGWLFVRWYDFRGCLVQKK